MHRPATPCRNVCPSRSPASRRRWRGAPSCPPGTACTRRRPIRASLWITWCWPRPCSTTAALKVGAGVHLSAFGAKCKPSCRSMQVCSGWACSAASLMSGLHPACTACCLRLLTCPFPALPSPTDEGEFEPDPREVYAAVSPGNIKWVPSTRMGWSRRRLHGAVMQSALPQPAGYPGSAAGASLLHSTAAHAGPPPATAPYL